MPVITPGSTELRTVASPVAEVVAPEPDAVEYPERRWIAQSASHGRAVRLATSALDQHFRDRDDVLVDMELVVYYERDNDQAWLRPDVLVVFGVERDGKLSTFKVWDKGKAPDFVLEVASPSTEEHDAEYKAEEYLRIGVREYWRLDPDGTLMGVPLEGYRARGGEYQPVELVAGPGGIVYLRSVVLGLDLRTTRRRGATVLVIRDPLTGEEFDDAVLEYDRQRRIAEDRASDAEDRASDAEGRASAAEDRASDAVSEMQAAKDALSAKDDELSATRDKLISSEERVRELEQQLRVSTGKTRPMG